MDGRVGRVVQGGMHPRQEVDVPYDGPTPPPNDESGTGDAVVITPQHGRVPRNHFGGERRHDDPVVVRRRGRVQRREYRRDGEGHGERQRQRTRGDPAGVDRLCGDGPLQWQRNRTADERTHLDQVTTREGHPGTSPSIGATDGGPGVDVLRLPRHPSRRATFVAPCGSQSWRGPDGDMTFNGMISLRRATEQSAERTNLASAALSAP